MPSLRSGSVLHASIQNCLLCLEYIYILPFNNFGLTLIRKVQFVEGDFSDERGCGQLPEVSKMSLLKKMLDFKQK